MDHEREGSYFTIPFEMPAEMESFSLTYQYERYHEETGPDAGGQFTSRQEINIIDLGIIAPDGSQVGVSGSDKTEIQISETGATPGYHACPLVPGEWQILVGAYKIAPEGVAVRYMLGFTPKRLRVYKGDLHIHTLASDGVLTSEELARHARRQGLDFLALTDHNQMVSREALPEVPGITLIPGIEWTHYQGHAGFLGLDKPYDGSFAANTLEGVQDRFGSARSRGATIVIEHPLDENCPFKFSLDHLPFDCLEVWNGPMRESNLRALAFWNSLLLAGKKIPICGGSDYHRDHLFIFPGGPTTCLYSMSAGQSDLLAALKRGHAYISFAPDGPALEMRAGNALPGDSVPFSDIQEFEMTVTGLLPGDVLRVVIKRGGTDLLKASTSGSFHGTYRMEAPGFVRLEVLRSFVPGLPRLPALLSNPIYFDPA